MSDVQFLRATGPFVWRYWEKDIMTFVKACSLKTVADNKDRIFEPHFIAPLERLDALYDRAIAASR
ncbi:MAG: hypothetical protein JNM03_01925 [Sphingopyxis sp.]|uniref:hypothetical protein n=1 Tax=unclassified Sphingopyxis TaxID=2614943 RepID=UPI001A387E20|nr:MULTISPECIES: hypothetical protein [unclassified Sphingopyxis]MBL9068733.1 hypothetical protein [Sphingopyxis sp.]